MNEQVVVLLNTAQDADVFLRRKAGEQKIEEASFLFDDLKALTESLAALFKAEGTALPDPGLPAYRTELETAGDSAILQGWLEQVVRLLPPQPLNEADRGFDALVKMVRKSSKAALVDKMLRSYHAWRKSVSPQVNQGFINFNAYVGFYGAFDPENDQYEMLEQRAEILKEHIDDFEWFYSRLCDYRSRMVLAGILRYWLDMCPEPMMKVQEHLYRSYFDLDLFSCGSDEFFVDVGSYIGDSALDYIDVYGADCFRQMYCYEIMDFNISKMEKSLSKYKNITIRPVGVGAEDGVLYLSDKVDAGGTRLQKEGAYSVPVVSLDSDISEPVSFIKMDIEGGEYDALLGARRHIQEDRPKLAVCLYHGNNDLWRLPRLIDSICPDYHYFLRYYGGGVEAPGGAKLVIADYVLYCVPKD